MEISKQANITKIWALSFGSLLLGLSNVVIHSG
jgi:hypothetical protein